MPAMASSESPSPGSRLLRGLCLGDAREYALNPVGAGLPAMAYSESPSPASRLLRGLCPGDAREYALNPVGAWLASDVVFGIAIASKPAPTRFVSWRRSGICPQSCRSLACQRWRLRNRHRQIKPAPTRFVSWRRSGTCPQSCRSLACQRWRLRNRHRQQAGSYEVCVLATLGNMPSIL